MLPSPRRLGAGRGKLAAFLALGLVGTLAASCGPAATISSVPGPPSAPINSPMASAAPTASSALASVIPTATPNPPPTARPMVTAPPVSRVTLSRIGNIASPSGVSVVSFPAGYVAFGTVDDIGSIATWFSADGRSWKRTIHSKTIVPCTGWSARSDLDAVHVGAALDGKVAIIAALADPAPGLCDRTRLIALVTSDGVTWERSAPFGPTGSAPEWSQQGWTVPAGIEIIVNENDSTPRLSTWRSSDGFAWQQVATRTVDSPEATFRVFGASPDGVRLAASQDSEGAATQILASDDGSTWRSVRTLPSGFGVADAVPPVVAGGPWLVVTVNIEAEPEKLVLLESADLATWNSAPFPRTAFSSVHLTPAGWIGVGEDPSTETGCNPCASPDAALYTSQDGLHWKRQATKVHGDGPILVNGPAGLLALDNTGGAQVVSLVAFH
jgi:hypothetical protein